MRSCVHATPSPPRVNGRHKRVNNELDWDLEEVRKTARQGMERHSAINPCAVRIAGEIPGLRSNSGLAAGTLPLPGLPSGSKSGKMPSQHRRARPIGRALPASHPSIEAADFAVASHSRSSAKPTVTS